jgi:hypothetical protein
MQVFDHNTGVKNDVITDRAAVLNHDIWVKDAVTADRDIFPDHNACAEPDTFADGCGSCDHCGWMHMSSDCCVLQFGSGLGKGELWVFDGDDGGSRSIYTLTYEQA